MPRGRRESNHRAGAREVAGERELIEAGFAAHPASVRIPVARRARPKNAWEHRESILAPGRRPPLARHFLQLIAERSREAYTVTEAARTLGVSRTSLERICYATFNLAPGLMINLGRVVSIARDLRETGQTLKQISIGHAFPTPSIMNRFFTRFVGMSPRTYRERARHHDPRPTDRNTRRTDH